MKRPKHYAWESVNASRNDRRLQSQRSVDEAKGWYLERARSCPKCETPADQLSWFYYVSDPQSWQSLAGRAGWMTVCDACHLQVDLFLEMMS